MYDLLLIQSSQRNIYLMDIRGCKNGFFFWTVSNLTLPSIQQQKNGVFAILL